MLSSPHALTLTVCAGRHALNSLRGVIYENIRSQVKNSRRGFDAVEVLVVALLTGVLAYASGIYSGRDTPSDNSELTSLAERYGPSHHSEHAEEWIIRDFFQGKRDGVFLDVGAYDYQRLSNTYYLETELGWSGVAVEPQVKFAADYLRYRPRTTFVPVFASDRSDGSVTLHIAPQVDTQASSSDAVAAANHSTEHVPVSTATLDDVLDRLGISKIDFMTLDVELAEPVALRGFSIDRFRPALVCVEAHEEVRQAILDYFARHAYTVIGRYLRADQTNLWFQPLPAPDGR